MLILLESQLRKNGPLIDYNKIVNIFSEKTKKSNEDRDENEFVDMKVNIFIGEALWEFLILEDITKEEYLKIASNISQQKTNYHNMFVPVIELDNIREYTFAGQLTLLHDYLVDKGEFENIKNFIKKAYDEVLSKLSRYELLTSWKTIEIMDEKYGGVEEYNILKYIYKYNNKETLTRNDLIMYEEGTLGKYNKK